MTTTTNNGRRTPLKQPGPLPFSITPPSDGSNADRYGDWFWSVGLPDGREVFLMADRMEVAPGGALVAWQDTKLIAADGKKRWEWEREALPGAQVHDRVRGRRVDLFLRG